MVGIVGVDGGVKRIFRPVIASNSNSNIIKGRRRGEELRPVVGIVRMQAQLSKGAGI